MTKYKSAELTNGQVKIVINDLPNPDEDTIFIKIFLSGICRADVKEVSDSRDIAEDRGPLFGHELNGIITFAGKDTGFKENQLVTFNPNVTPNRTTGFADYMILKAPKNILKQAVIPYDRKLDKQKTILVEPLSATYHSLEKLIGYTGPIKSKKIAIIGAGNAGTMLGLFAKRKGASVKLFNIDDGRIQFAQKIFEKDEVFKFSDYSKFEFDIVIVTITIITPKSLKMAYECVKSDGFIHLYGGTRSDHKFLDTEVNIDTIRRNELLKTINYKGKIINLTGAYGSGPDDFKSVFNILDDLPVNKLISKQIQFQEFPKLIMDMARGKVDYPGKVIVRYSP